MELAPFSSPEDESMVAGVSKGHFPPPLWMRTAMWSGSIQTSPVDSSDRFPAARLEKLLLAAEHELEGEQLAQRRPRQPPEEAVEARAERPDADQRVHLEHPESRLGGELARVPQGEPAQVRRVEDALLAPRPAPARAELPEGLEEAHVREVDHDRAIRLEQVRRAAQRSPGVDQVLEHVGGDDAVEAAEILAREGLHGVALDDPVEPPARGCRIAWVELDPHDLGSGGPSLQRRPE